MHRNRRERAPRAVSKAMVGGLNGQQSEGLKPRHSYLRKESIQIIYKWGKGGGERVVM